jgi:hypothetical protein
MNFSINTPLTVTYSVDKCTFPQFNGEHTETFDLSKLTNDDFEQYLAQTLIIKRQSQLRSKTAINSETNVAKVVVGNWIVPAPGKRIATTPIEKATAMLDKLSPEQKRAFLLAALAEQDRLAEEEALATMLAEEDAKKEEDTEPDH